MVFWRRWLGGSLGGLLVIACGGTPQPAPTPVVPSSTEELGVFQSQRAWADLEAIVGAGSRRPGSAGAAAARAYIKQALRGVGLTAEERVTTAALEGLNAFELTHLSVTIPGVSPDRFVLLSAYDSDHFAEFENRGVNLGASGAALLLEMARVLTDIEPAYTVQLLFVEGDGRLGIGTTNATIERRGLGSELLAQQMAEADELEGVRLLIAFRGVCDADLSIARDLLSHRHYREEFWRVARDLGHGDVFQRAALFQSVEAGHRAFVKGGLRAVLSVSDTAYGGSEPPGLYANNAEDVLEHCSSESLEIVGSVTLKALERIGARLDRIDRFTTRPLATPVAEADLSPGPSSTAPAEGGE